MIKAFKKLHCIFYVSIFIIFFILFDIFYLLDVCRMNFLKTFKLLIDLKDFSFYSICFANFTLYLPYFRITLNRHLLQTIKVKRLVRYANKLRKLNLILLKALLITIILSVLFMFLCSKKA